MGGWLRHRPGNVGPRSKHPGITGAMGPPMSWDPWPTRSCERPWVGDAGVYTDWRKRPLGAVLGHLCTLLRRELRRVARAPQPPWRADGAPLGGHLSLSRETRLCASGAVARLASSSGRQPTNPRKARKQPGAAEQDGPSGGRDEPHVGNAL